MRATAARAPTTFAASCLIALGAETLGCAELASADAWPSPSSGAGASHPSGAGGGGSGANGGGGGDGGSAAGGGVGACSSLTALHEDFSKAPVRWVLYSSAPAYMPSVESPGELHVPLPPVSSGDGFAQTRAGFQLAGSDISARYSLSGATPDIAVAALALYDVNGGSGMVEIQSHQGTISAQVIDGTARAIMAGTRRDEGFQYFHVRQSGGTIDFAVSKDGSNLVDVGSTGVPSDGSVDLLHLRLGASKPGDANGGFVAFDDVNDPALSAPGDYCPVDTLEDDFEDGITGARWHQYESLAVCDVNEAGGQLVVAPGMTQSECGYQSWLRYRLTDSGVVVDAPLTMRDPASYAWMRLQRDPENAVSIGVHQTLLHLAVSHGGSNTDLPIQYDPVLHRYWKIHTQGTKVVWSTSVDGETWKEVHSALIPFELTDLQLQLVGGNDQEVGTAPDIRFDNLNVAAGE